MIELKKKNIISLVIVFYTSRIKSYQNISFSLSIYLLILYLVIFITFTIIKGAGATIISHACIPISKRKISIL